MTVTELLTHQVSDIFRWGLLIGLVVTARNTRATTGTVVPLAAGVVFVAAIIPMVMTPGLAPLPAQIGVGLAANVAILAAVLAGFAFWRRIAGR